VLLLREKKHKFIETLLEPKKIVYAILLGLPTAICFGLITIRLSAYKSYEHQTIEQKKIICQNTYEYFDRDANWLRDI
jgi:hypothetical protein